MYIHTSLSLSIYIYIYIYMYYVYAYIGRYSLVVRTLAFLARGPGFESWHRDEMG